MTEEFAQRTYAKVVHNIEQNSQIPNPPPPVFSRYTTLFFRLKIA